MIRGITEQFCCSLAFAAFPCWFFCFDGVDQLKGFIGLILLGIRDCKSLGIPAVVVDHFSARHPDLNPVGRSHIPESGSTSRRFWRRQLGFELSWVKCIECNASSNAVAASLVRAETSRWSPAADRRVGVVSLSAGPSPPRYYTRCCLFSCPSPPSKHQQLLTSTPSCFASAYPRPDHPKKTVFVSQNVSFPSCCRRVYWLDHCPRPGGAAGQCQAYPL